MSLVETLAGVAVGSVLGFVGSVLSQDLLSRRQKMDEVRERVYSPLYDEINDHIEQLEEHGDVPSAAEWSRISKQEHLTYLINDNQLQQDLRKFYDQTLTIYTKRKNSCTSRYPALITADLQERLRKVNHIVQQQEVSDTSQVSQGVGWNLHGSWTPMHVEAYSSSYERLRSIVPFKPEKLDEYFEWWAKKTRDDKEIKEYRDAREQAIDEAKSLRDRLADKLGVKSDQADQQPSKAEQGRQPTKWESFRETLGAVGGVIFGDLLANAVTGAYYYGLGLISAFLVALVPALILRRLQMKRALDEYKRLVASGSAWFAAILVANMLTSAWNIFKLDRNIGLLALGLFFLVAFLGTRLLSLSVGSFRKS